MTDGPDCWLVSPKVEWMENGARGYLKNPPKGSLIDALFEDWRDAELREDVARAIYGEYPDANALSKWLCEYLCGGTCPGIPGAGVSKERATGRRRSRGGQSHKRNPRETERMMRELRESEMTRANGPNELRHRLLHPLFWKVLSNHSRRAVVILAILGDRGMRKGGYHYSDLQRISGVRRNGPTERMLSDLIDMGYIEKTHRRNPRYKYRIVFSSDYTKGRRGKILTRVNEEGARMHARDLGRFLEKSAPGHPKHRYIEGSNFGWIGPCIIAGDQPPSFVIDLMTELAQEIWPNLLDGFNGIADIAISRKARGEGLVYDIETDGETLRSMVERLNAVLEQLNEVNQSDARDWESYRVECLKGKKRSVVAFDLPQIMEMASR